MSRDSDRPDGDAERLVRIETRLVQYQQTNALAMEEVVKTLAKLTAASAELTELLKEVIEHG